MTRPDTVEEHLARVLGGVAPLPAVVLPIAETLGLVCVEDVVSAIDLPGFDNSAMDGYAVRLADVTGATEQQPVVLPVVGQIGAGQAQLRELAAGEAAKIMTGAPVPAGADVVVPYEWTDRGAEQVRISQQPAPGQHLRPRGDDVAAGDLLLHAGTVLGPRQIGLLASVGRAEGRVRPRTRASVLSTGSELREPGAELGHDSIHDGNSYLLEAAVRRVGAVPVRVGIVRDEPGAFMAVLDGLLGEVDLVVTSGGVSQGDYDVVKAALRAEGVWFGPVAMQPGKPQGFGLLADGAGRPVPIVTLPGNPVSSYISFEVFVLPAIRRLMGLTPESTPLVLVTLGQDVGSPVGRRQFMRGIATTSDSGPVAVPEGGPASHLVGALATANCLIVIPEDVTSMRQGERVQVLMLDER